MKKRFALAALFTAAAVALAGCADDRSTEAASPKFNEADVTFVQGMIPHHQQAIEMAKMAEGRAVTPEVQELAADIEAAQEPEIEMMTQWLEAWGEEVPSMDGGMDHGGMEDGDMGGMAAEDMGQLEDASGPEFDRMFLTMMIEHHNGAIEMAQTEQANGENPDAVALAEKIESDQESEIDKMQDLLDA